MPEETGPLTKKQGKRHYPWLHNRPSVCTADELRRGRQYIPHGYGIDYEFTPHLRHIVPKHTNEGPDWSSRIKWLPSPDEQTSESARFVEIWPESWKGLRVFPGCSQQTKQNWILHPHGCDSTLKCYFDGVHRSTTQSSAEKAFLSGSRFIIDKRNGIPAAAPGDKSYKSVEYSPNFHKHGSTLPVVNFGATHKQKFDTFIPLLQVKKSPRKSFREKELIRRKEEDFREVCALDNWRPATPLIYPTVHNNTRH